MTKAIGKALGKPVFFPAVPGFALKLILGEMADIVLKGSKVSSEKIQKAGYSFKFTSIESALEDLLSS
jgi:NAD dependent epimerase/dehydratase family enzyme